MKALKNLAKLAMIPAVAFGLEGCLYNKYDAKLNLPEGEVKYNFVEQTVVLQLWHIREDRKDGTIVKYETKPHLSNSIKDFKVIRLKINDELYFHDSSKDSLVIAKANERAHKLVDRYYFVTDSTRRAEGLKALE